MELPRYITDKPIIKKRLMDLSQTMIQIFDSEPAVLRIGEPTMIVGDIHGNLYALNLIIEQWKESKCENILFLGDYIDRGSQGAECLLMLFDNKITDPNHVFLLRGNHEDAQMNVYYGFYDEIGHDNSFLMCMNKIFQKMPIAATISRKIFCVHGGITKETDLNNITKANSYQYLWNDPSDVLGINSSNRGEGIMEFGPDIVDNFLVENKFSCIIRAHEYQKRGYKWWFDRKLLSIFSSTNYSGRINNGAFGIYEDGKLELYSFDSKNNIEKCE